MNGETRLELLVQCYADGSLDENGYRELENALNSDPKARAHFLEALKMHASLHVLHGGAARADKLNQTLAKASDRKLVPLLQERRRRLNWRWAAAAASVALVLLGYAAMRGNGAPVPVQPSPGKEHVVMASLVSDGGGGILVQRDTRKLQVAQKFELREEDEIIVVASEWATVTLLDGSTMRMGGPCTLKISLENGANRAYLAAGAIDCHIQPQKSGPMIISTPSGRAVVLGTIFQMNATASGSTLEVVSGKVRVEDTDAKHTLVVGTNQRVQLAAGQPFVAQPIIPDVVGWWRFEENSGDTSMDYSGLNNTATIPDKGVTWAEGRQGGGIRFTPGSSPVNCGNPPAFNSPAFSVSAWFKSDSAGEKFSESIFSKDTRTEVQYALCVQKGSKLRVNLGSTPPAFGSTFVTPGIWHHVVLTYDGREVKLYLDKKLEAARVVNLALKDCGAPFLIGKRSFEQTPFAGVIDEVRIYSVALTQDQVNALP
jgi:ferric-dicitrate binding protein FerR (iron transport regulator)